MNTPKYRRVSQTGVSQEIQESTQHSLHNINTLQRQPNVSSAKDQTVKALPTKNEHFQLSNRIFI